MESRRRALLAMAAMAPATAWPDVLAADPPVMAENRLVLSSFEEGEVLVMPGVSWRGFSDRVMGGVSDAEFVRATVAGKDCLRLSGRVTRDSGGGFIQMALDVGSRGAYFDGSAYAGVEFLVHGNDEDYNCHIRTADCGWYDQSYRVTFRAASRWQRLNFAWQDFRPNGVTVPLDPSKLQRIALLGWMRDFTADISLAEMALYS
ncbi:MAG: CIA30 family protein [Gammaproteobacteria bacterium]|nr:CIA30 family protein [Gammaproteobacteria bacterium]